MLCGCWPGVRWVCRMGRRFRIPADMDDVLGLRTLRRCVTVIVCVLLFISMPFGLGYSFVVISAGYGFSWLRLPPVLLGGVAFGPALEYAETLVLFCVGKHLTS